MSTKQEFLTQKINNFIIFIEQKIGKENKIYSDFIGYSKNLNNFLQAIIQLGNFAKSNGGINEESIKKYLEIQGVKKNLEKEDFIKIIRYFDMFIKIVD